MPAPAAVSFASPLKINCGRLALAHLPFELASRRLKAPLILASRERIGEKRLRRVVDAFSASGLVLAVYDRLHETREDDLLPALARMYQDARCDCVLAVGSGGIVDTAKCLNLFISGVVIAEASPAGIGPLVPLLMVPTPGGDGYEASGHAMDDKEPFRSSQLVPTLATIDPVMMEDEANDDAIEGALIGLTHAIEAFLDEDAGPPARAYAHAAIDSIVQYLPQALENRERKRSLAVVVGGQVVAGCAFSATAPGGCHRAAKRINETSDLPFGIRLAMLLPHLLTVFGDHSPDAVGRLLYPLAGPETYGLIDPGLRVPNSISIIEAFLHTLNAYLAVPIPLSFREMGLATTEIDAIVQIAKNADDDLVARIIDCAVKGITI